MAKAPTTSVKKSKDDKAVSKSRSSANEVSKEKTKSKSTTSSNKDTRKPAAAAAVSDAPPVKSVLKETRPVPSFNLVQEQDFPRGAAPPSKASKVAKLQQSTQEKGLFDVSLWNYLLRRILC
jgi:hypothetical protein